MSEQEQPENSREQPNQRPYKETKWYDAWIRWEKGSKETYDVEDEDEDEEDEPPMIPTDTYQSSYQVPSHNDEMKTINLELRGFPSESEAIWTSTGLTLWRSAEFLCDYLVEHHGKLCRLCGEKPCRILEVGSGLGRSGILMHLLAYAAAASSKGQEESKSDDTPADDVCQQQVVLTDGDTDVLAQLRSNVQHNLELNSKLVQSCDGDSHSKSSDLSCHQLIWGKDHAKAFAERPCFHSSSEGNDSDTTYFDVMIGSDLIYVTQVIEPLFETVQTLLHPKHGVFLMAHCARREGNEVDLDAVLEHACKVGFQYTQLLAKDETCSKHDHEDGIYLYKFEWSTKD